LLICMSLNIACDMLLHYKHSKHSSCTLLTVLAHAWPTCSLLFHLDIPLQVMYNPAPSTANSYINPPYHQACLSPFPSLPPGLLQVVYNPELAHGAFLLVPEVKAAILGQLKQLLASSGNAVAGLGRGLTSLLLSRTYTLTGPGGSSSVAPGAGGRRALPTLASVASGLLASRKSRWGAAAHSAGEAAGCRQQQTACSLLGCWHVQT
jgi:hypothetical protein